MVSAASLTVILSTRSQMPAATMDSWLTYPGLMPEPNIVEPPCLQAAAILSRPSPWLCPVMKEAVATTFTPADRILTSSSTSIHIGL